MGDKKVFSGSNVYVRLSLLLVLIFVLLFSIAEISAAEIQLQKNSTVFDSGETLVAQISGNFVDQPTKDNVFFYRGHVKIPMDFEIQKINEDFYVYTSLMDRTQGNYSITLEGVSYMSGNQETNATLTKNFTITNNTSDFSITPGFVSTTGDFSIQVTNLKPSKITLKINPSANIKSVTSNSTIINSGDIKTLDFKVQQSDLDSGTIEFSSGNTTFVLQVFLSQDLTTKEPIFGMKFEPETVDVSLATHSDTKRITYLINTGNTDLENLSFIVSASLVPYITVVPQDSKIDKGETQKIELLITSDSKEKIIEGKIQAVSENATTEMTLVLNFIKDYIPTDGSLTEEETASTTCSQLNGSICGSTQACEGEVAKVLDGNCCLSTCKISTKSYTGKIIGWSIIGVIIIALYLFYKRRYKRVGMSR